MFWPYLWSDPLVNFVSTLKNMSAYAWRGSIFYLGDYISAENLPWHYPLVWIFITTPVLYLFLFISGSSAIIFKSVKKFNYPRFVTDVENLRIIFKYFFLFSTNKTYIIPYENN